MDRLSVAVAFDLLVDWGLLGLAIRHTHNIWLLNLAIVPQLLFSLWVLSGLGERPFPRLVIALAVWSVLGIAIVEAIWVGLGTKWSVSLIAWSLVLLALCLWKFVDLLIQLDGESVYHQPAFWMLSAWVLMQGNHLTFHPLSSLFLQRLSLDWVLVPWFMNYSVGLLLTLSLSKTFLCLKSSSS